MRSEGTPIAQGMLDHLDKLRELMPPYSIGDILLSLDAELFAPLLGDYEGIRLTADM